MIRKIQILGAGAFVAFALVFAASEVMTPVASAAQSPNNCCKVGVPGTCAGELECVAGAPAGCPVSLPAYDGTCKQKKKTVDPIPGGGDS